VRGDTITRLTEDQTYARRLVEEGQLEPHEEETSIHKNTLTSFIGTNDCSPQVELLDLEGGEIFVLCSDGMMEGMNDADIKDVACNPIPSVATQALVVRSKERIREKFQKATLGTEPMTSDNMTAVIIKVLSPLRRPASMEFEESPKGTAEND
jgi:protein phosphatase